MTFIHRHAFSELNPVVVSNNEIRIVPRLPACKLTPNHRVIREVFCRAMFERCQQCTRLLMSFDREIRRLLSGARTVMSLKPLDPNHTTVFRAAYVCSALNKGQD